LIFIAAAHFSKPRASRFESEQLCLGHQPGAGDTNNYRIKLTSVGDPAVTDSSDANFSVFGSTGTLNPLFGQALQANGGLNRCSPTGKPSPAVRSCSPVPGARVRRTAASTFPRRHQHVR